MLARLLKPLIDRQARIVLLLGFSSGLPYLLVGGTLGVWLRETGLDIATVGLFAWASIPYSFNFAWAPLVDQLALPFLTRRMGKRRSWMLLSQLLLFACLLALSFIQPEISLLWVALVALLAAFCSATQDIVIDAFRTEFLPKDRYQDGAAMAVFGYRIGVLCAGAGALALADMAAFDWQDVYQLMALLMLVGIATTLSIREPEHPPRDAAMLRDSKGWLRYALLEPFRNFAARHTLWPWVLLLIFAYRLPDGFIGFISYSFYIDQGFSKTEVAAIVKLYGLIATLAGAVLGATLMRRYGLYACLVGALVMQMITNLTYMGFSVLGPSQTYLMLVISIDNLGAGIITAAAITYMMQLCDLRFTATQYALLSSLASLASKTLAGGAGIVAQSYGWNAMFVLSAVLGLPALFILLWLRERLIPSATPAAAS
jgi:MFS transporter, PAT family, beta-lactamase induction signal transducer AmpG